MIIELSLFLLSHVHVAIHGKQMLSHFLIRFQTYLGVLTLAQMITDIQGAY